LDDRWVSERVEEMGGTSCTADESRLAAATALAVVAKEALTMSDTVDVDLSALLPEVQHATCTVILLMRTALGFGTGQRQRPMDKGNCPKNRGVRLALGTGAKISLEGLGGRGETAE
jgi:hypothetical protein